MATFAERLRDLRTRCNLTQEALAAAMGVSRSAMAGYEAPSKKRQPDFELVCRLARFFGVSVDYLLGCTDDPAPLVPDPDLVAGARYLEALRTSRGWTREDLASRLGIDLKDLVRYEIGAARLPDDVATKLAGVFEVDPRCFTGDLSQAEMEEILGETWFRAPVRLSPEARRAVEDFIGYMTAQEERKKREGTQARKEE